MSHNHTNQSSGSQAAVTQKELKITPTRFGKYVKTKSDLTSAIEPFSGSGALTNIQLLMITSHV
jgi:hypothetical protein